MSQGENRHHRRRLAANRIRQLSALWKPSPEFEQTTGFHASVVGKTNPLTRCSCCLCSDSYLARQWNRADRHRAKLQIASEAHCSTKEEAELDEAAAALEEPSATSE